MGSFARRAKTRIASIAIASSMAAVTGSVVFAMPAFAASTPMVSTTSVNLRTGPSTSYSIITLIPQGASLTATGPASGSWTPVSYNGQAGYVWSSYIAPAPTASSTTSSSTSTSAVAVGSAVVNSEVNVRTGPGTSYTIVAVATTGTKVGVTGKTSGSWVQVIWSGTTRWIYGDYLDITYSAVNVTSSTAAPTASAPTSSSTPSTTSTSTTSTVGSKVAAYAKAHLGAPYSVGSAGPTYYDCSGLVYAAYKAAGVSIPYSMTTQASMGTYVSKANLQVGDVVVWGSPVRAVSIYVGDDTVILADGPSYGIRADKISTRSGWETVAGGRRYA